MPEMVVRSVTILGATLLALLVLSLSGCSGCRESNEETLSRLTALLEQGEGQRAISEVESLLAANEAKVRREMPGLAAPGLLARSLDGSTAAWSNGALLFYLHAVDSAPANAWPEPGELPLSGVARGIYLSPGGEAAIVRVSSGSDRCDLDLHVLRDSPRLVRTISAVDCGQSPAVSDQLDLYYSKDGAIFHEPLEPTAAARELVKKSELKPRFSGIAQSIHITDSGGEDLIILHGAAGHYQLYAYRRSNNQLRSIAQGYASPQMLPTSTQHVWPPPVLPLAPQPEPPGVESEAESTRAADGENAAAPQSPAPQVERPPIQALLYFGTPGRYALRTIHLPTLRVEELRATEPLDRPIYLRETGEFMLFEDGHINLWNPRERYRNSLPFDASDFILFDAGLLLVDQERRVALRKLPLTPFELHLIELKKEHAEQLHTSDDREEDSQ